MRISRAALMIAPLLYFCMLSVLWFLFIIIYQAPSLSGNLANLSVVSSWFLLLVLWGISATTAILVLLMRVNKRTVAALFFAAILFSSGVVLIKEQIYKYRLARFFGDYKKGRIVFAPEFKSGVAADAFSLMDRSTGKYPAAEYKRKFNQFWRRSNSSLSPDGEYLLIYRDKTCKFEVFETRHNQQISTLQHWVICSAAVSWSPDSKFLVYDYAYDRDDLSKIFVTNVKTGEALLLAAGWNPVWVK